MNKEYKRFKFTPKTIDGLRFKNVQYHRNGICGDGFHCAIVTDKKWAKTDLLITHFDIKDHCACAVYQVDLLPNIAFGENSWRGDNYTYSMVKAIKEYNSQYDNWLGFTTIIE